MRHYAIPLLLTILVAGCDSSAVSPTSKTKLDGKTPSPDSPSKAQDGVQQITFDDLNIRKLLNVEEVIYSNDLTLPESVSHLDGKRVRIRGWIEPPHDVGFEQRTFLLFRHKPELEFARIKNPDIEPVAAGDHVPEVFGLESTDNVDVIDPPTTADLDFSLELPEGINRNPKYLVQADETIHVRLRKGVSLKNTRKSSVEVIGNLNVEGISVCPPARWMYVLKDAEVVEIPDAE